MQITEHIKDVYSRFFKTKSGNLETTKICNYLNILQYIYPFSRYIYIIEHYTTVEAVNFSYMQEHEHCVWPGPLRKDAKAGLTVERFSQEKCLWEKMGGRLGKPQLEMQVWPQGKEEGRRAGWKGWDCARSTDDLARSPRCLWASVSCQRSPVSPRMGAVSGSQPHSVTSWEQRPRKQREAWSWCSSAVFTRECRRGPLVKYTRMVMVTTDTLTIEDWVRNKTKKTALKRISFNIKILYLTIQK